MNIYGKLPQEQAAQTLVHDTNRALSKMQRHIDALSDWLKANKDELKSVKTHQVFISIEYLKTSKREIREALDEYINQLQNDFPTP